MDNSALANDKNNTVCINVQYTQMTHYIVCMCVNKLAKKS